MDLVDEVFVVAEPAVVAAAVHDPALWRRWWPDLELTVFQDRGAAGLRFTVTGAMVGTSELWLEPWGDGVVVHSYLRANPTRRGSATEPRKLGPWRARREARRRALAVKSAVNALKDELERGRVPGEPREAPPRH